jgi:3-oxoacyl-[acyl-carrier protein] reductase
MRLKDKVALVTGATSGFGEAIALRFAQEGARVVVNGRNVANATQVLARIQEAVGPGRAIFAPADVSRASDWATMVEQSLSAFGRIDVLVNNAGAHHRVGPMLEVDEAMFCELFEVNLKSIFLSAHHVVPVMRRQGGGVIINNTSIAAKRPRAGQTWYAGLKAGAVAVSKSMAIELGPEHIRVNALCPVMTPTPMITERLTPEREALAVREIPLGRLGRVSDIANAALYLASDEAEFITGVALEVDGGRSI